jgi:hypothetical protein
MTFDDLKGRPSPEKWNQLLDRLAAMRVASGPGIRVYQGPQGQVVSALQSRRRPADRTVPFEVTGPTKEEDAWHATVGEGYVVERDVKRPTGGNSVILHTADNHFEEESVDELRKFVIEAGESIFVRVEVNKRGEIAITPEDPPEDPEPPAVTLEVGSTADTKSEHYAPEIGATLPGQPGVYYYELARFTAGEEEGSLVMEPVLAGQHVCHWQELPTFENAGGATIWKEWAAATGVYKTKGITALAPLTATAQENSVELSFGGAKDLDLTVETLEYIILDGYFAPNENASPQSVTHYWRGGVYIGSSESETDPLEGLDEPPAGLIQQTVTRMQLVS